LIFAEKRATPHGASTVGGGVSIVTPTGYGMAPSCAAGVAHRGRSHQVSSSTGVTMNVGGGHRLRT
jgi:hypothetical protein